MVGVVKMCLLPKVKINTQKLQQNNGLDSNPDTGHTVFSFSKSLK